MTSPIPEGHSTLAPNIVVQGGQEALGFYERAFGGQVVLRRRHRVSAPADQFHGDRVGTLRCPYGHRWIIASRTREMTQEEMQQAMEEAFGG